MDADRFFTRLNPLILWLLRSPLHSIMSGQLLSLSFEGRRSGRQVTIPVGYQWEGEAILVLVSKAPRKQWWRNFHEPAPVNLIVRGQRLAGHAHLVPAYADVFREAYERSFDRIPLLSQQFGLEPHRAGQPLSEEQLAIVAEQGRLVRIELDRS
jgi:hypothetical protein